MPLWLVILLAYLFEFANGWTDAPNSIATVVSTRVLRPLQAVGMAAVLNLIGALAGMKVAETVGTDVVDARFLTLETIAAVLVAATIWAMGAQYFGLPSSESHALIAGLPRGGICGGGTRRPPLRGPSQDGDRSRVVAGRWVPSRAAHHGCHLLDVCKGAAQLRPRAVR
jgi:phosphate/sulfate permease